MITHYHACWQPARDPERVERNTRVGLWDTAESELRTKGALALTVAGVSAGVTLEMRMVTEGRFELRDKRNSDLWATAWVEPCRGNCT